MATSNFSASLKISWKYWVFSWVLRREYPCIPGVNGSRFVKFFSARV